MGRLAALLSTRATYEQAKGTLKEGGAWLEDWFQGGRTTAAGKSVTEQSALKCGVVYACVNVYASSVAALPLNLQRRLDRGKERATDHPLFDLLKYEPNPTMSSYVFRETAEGHVKTWGNFYARIQRDPKRRIVALWTMRPDWVSVKLVRGEKVYEHRRPDQTEPEVYFADDIFHVHGMGYDGLVGYSPVRMAMETIGWIMATSEYGASFFGNSSRIAGILKHPQAIGAEAAKNLREQWEELRKGSANAHRTAVLEDGVSWEQIGIPQNEAQFIETLDHQVPAICRWYNMPPHKVQHLLHATFSNIESSQLSFATDTLMPELVRWEHEIGRQLLTREERNSGLFAEFMMDAILRGDSATRHANYASGRQWGYLSPNDVRAMESQNPIEGDGGDDYHVPINMVRLQDASLTPDPTMGGPGDGNEQASSRAALPAGAERRTVALRQRLQRAAIAVFRQAAERIGRREAEKVAAAARRMTRAAFTSWLRTYYGDDFDAAFIRDFQPVMAMYGQQIGSAAAAELGSIGGDDSDLDTFIASYTSSFAARYRKSSLAQLERVVDETPEDGDFVGAVGARLGEWATGRPSKVAGRETIQAGAAIAKAVFIAAGVTNLVWRAYGSDTCDICQGIDGRVVGIEQNFVEEGETVPGGPDQTPLKSSISIGHPPIHAGCECMISAA